jgi:hypothetical protein
LIPLKKAAGRPNDMSLGFRHIAMHNLALWKKFAQFRKGNAYKKKKAARISGGLGNFCHPGWTAPGSPSSRAELKN